ncbi:MAG: PHP domain-containing protein [Clostridia bacterium]|nr:PHP domain-containing protein [Clostridia bacterium]
MRLYYDLHLHSCLSPCGDDDMTPMNMAGMGMLKGLSVMALTDHNTVKNCPAFFEACEGYGIVPIAGMELSTAEDVHMVCLFPTLASAQRFEAVFDSHRMPIDNDPEVFGNQIVMGSNDCEIGRMTPLLIAASDLWMGDAVALVREMGGVIYPAHIDRTSSGIVAILGDIPPEYAFTAMEYRDGDKREAYEALYPEAKGKTVVVSSDAHTLGRINEAENFFDLPLKEGATHDEIRAAILHYLDPTWRI